jgi:hypothetical protein
MSDNMENNETNDMDSEDSDIPVYSIEQLSAMGFNIAMVPLVKQMLDSERDYRISYDLVYGSNSPKFSAWKDALDDCEIEAYSYDEGLDEDNNSTLMDIARLSENPALLNALIEYLTDCLSEAKANLQGHYAMEKRGNVINNGDDIKTQRDLLDSYIASLVNLGSTPLLDMDMVWKLIPSRVKVMSKTNTKRTIYNGPSIPQTRQSSPFRKNAKLAIFMRMGNGNFEMMAGEFGAIVKTLGYTVKEFRDKYYSKGLEFNAHRTLADGELAGRTFYLVKKDDSDK